MLRNGEAWTLPEPELNEDGLPIVHDIASKLGCIRSSSETAMNFPENERDCAELEARLQAAAKAHQKKLSEQQADDLATTKVAPRSTKGSANGLVVNTNLERLSSDDTSPCLTSHSSASSESSLASIFDTRHALTVDAHRETTPTAALFPGVAHSPLTETSPWSSGPTTQDFFSQCHPLHYTAQLMAMQKQTFAPDPPAPSAFADALIAPSMLDPYRSLGLASTSSSSACSLVLPDPMDSILLGAEF